jgi:hypothetical protein
VEWYLPAIDELKLLLLNDEVRNAVNKTLDQQGANKLSAKSIFTWYWSSSEFVGNNNKFCAWGVDMGCGHAYRNYKGDLYSVRAVSAF